MIAKRSIALSIGVGLLVLGGLMGYAVACTFTATEMPPPPLDTVLKICFWGGYPAMFVGAVIVFVIGLFVPPKNSGISN